MKQSPDEQRLEELLRSRKIVAGGLMGNDQRSPQEIVETDLAELRRAGYSVAQLALRMKDDDWQDVLDINLTAAFRVARASLRGMAKQRWGRIISISSVVGQTGNPGQVNYAAAKAGLVGMSKALALEMATRGVTVNCVAPGFIETAMTAALGDDVRATLADRIPAQKLGVPDDVAGCVVFLASDEAGYVTGQTLHVNGGMVMV